MIHGLKVAFTGDEIIRSLDDRIESHRAAIQFKRDEIDGKVEITTEYQLQEPVEAVENEIRDLEHRIRILTMFRERVLPGETYLLGRRALKRTGLMPRPEARAIEDWDSEKPVRGVTRAVG